MGYKLGYHILVLPNQVLLINSVLTNEVLLYVVQRFSLLRGHYIIYLEPQKQSVVERCLLLGEFVVRGSTVAIGELIFDMYV